MTYLKYPNARLCVACLVLILILYLWPYFRIETPLTAKYESFNSQNNIHPRCVYLNQKLDSFWRNRNYETLPIPKDVLINATPIIVQSHMIKVNGVDLHYKESRARYPSSALISVFLLHGAAFSSSSWEALGTLNLLSAFGYRAVAIDLPGFGMTRATGPFNKGQFLFNVLAALKLKNPVIISPSMSGVFSMPFVLRHWKKISGYVPVSPVIPLTLPNICKRKGLQRNMTLDNTCQQLMKFRKNSYKENLSCVKIPVMIVYGERDKGENSARLCAFPWSTGVEIPDGKHAAYLSNPPLWHKLLYNFLHIVNKTYTCY